MRARIINKDEDGAVAVLVAISLVMFFGLAAVAVDLGGMWNAKRNLIPDLDSAALAVANDLGRGSPACAAAAADPGGSGVNATADSLMGANGLSARVGDVKVACVGSAGAVRVSGSLGSEQTFSQVLGASDLVVDGAAYAQFGPASTAPGLRPFAICKDVPDLQEWLALESPRPPSDPVTYKFNAADKKTTSGCGGSPGNFGLLCFTGECGEGKNKPLDIPSMVLNGYPGVVDLGSATDGDEDCDSATSDLDACTVKTGCPTNNNTAQALDALIADGTVFPILVYDSLQGPGGTAEYSPYAFLGVRVLGYQLTGGDCATERWLELEFNSITLEGRAGSGPNTGVTAINLCGADRDPTGAPNCLVNPD